MFGGTFFGPTYFGPSYWGTGEFVEPPVSAPEPGGGQSKRLPPRHLNWQLAMREDEDFIAAIQAYLSRKKH